MYSGDREVPARYEQEQAAGQRTPTAVANCHHRGRDRRQRQSPGTRAADIVGDVEEPADLGTFRAAGCARLLHHHARADASDVVSHGVERDVEEGRHPADPGDYARPAVKQDPGVWSDSPGVRGIAQVHDDEFKACVALQAQYIFDMFGKFPGTVPTVFILNYVQAHHLDLEFYDRFFQPGAYLETHATHMARWHGQDEEG